MGIDTIKKFAEQMKSENVSRAILVVQTNLTPFARAGLSELSGRMQMEVFLVSIC